MKPLKVDDLAHIAGMGLSTLHNHFRALTAMSPLQYQKQLRLQAARGRMLMDGMDAASAARRSVIRVRRTATRMWPVLGSGHPEAIHLTGKSISDFGPAGSPEPGVLSNGSRLVATDLPIAGDEGGARQAI
jgi:hypothetical protein